MGSVATVLPLQSSRCGATARPLGSTFQVAVPNVAVSQRTFNVSVEPCGQEKHPNGVGTSMQERRLTAIPPTMTLSEALETTPIHRVASRTDRRTAVVTRQPFRSPYQTIADVGLIGGGHVLMPGDVSPAYYIVLNSRPGA
jgi:Magnesium chelatase, subunit ChlI